MNNTSYANASMAFYNLYYNILNHGVDFRDTKALFNIGFYIQEPWNNDIKVSWRKWNKEYAETEWQWYLTGDRNPAMVEKYAKLWSQIKDEKGEVNSNYGYEWNRNNQLQRAVDALKKDPQTRQASISLFDGKETQNYGKDWICTYAVNFTILDNKLCMNVVMRSNDLIYGFCNDQYCFSSLQAVVARALKLPIGPYYHFAQNLHIYNRHLDLHKRNSV